MIESLKEAIAIGTVLVAVGAGYTGLQKDVSSVQQEVTVMQEQEARHNEYIQSDAAATARIDERTKAMQQQLERIEKSVGAK